MPVVVVTDSSARLPEELRLQWGIRQVPLHILLDGTDLRDGVDDIPGNIHEYGGATTAAATPAELADIYRQALADSGGDGVIAVHLSKALSGTLGAAETSAAAIGSAVRVLDSKFTGMNTGFIALAAARAAADGALDLAAALAERLPVCEPAIVTDLGPVLALHVGAGALAVCLEVSGDVVPPARS